MNQFIVAALVITANLNQSYAPCAQFRRHLTYPGENQTHWTANAMSSNFMPAEIFES